MLSPGNEVLGMLKNKLPVAGQRACDMVRMSMCDDDGIDLRGFNARRSQIVRQLAGLRV